MKIIFQKKKLLVIVPCTNHQKKKKFYTQIYNKYNKFLSDFVFDNNKKPGYTSQHIQEKNKKLWNKN